MRKSTIASVLILCGSTAALAQVATPAPTQDINNNIVTNETPPPTPSPMPAPEPNPTPAPDPVTNNTAEPPTSW
ncbi:hypothetical protein [Sphingomonas sp.]|uniref:hypothetical protein n=1 Tax=Sphingomonas sp. TaxID=28214 RepID=UPI002DD6B786|nr:hypothetical protein [Sphingomonas sp.]